MNDSINDLMTMVDAINEEHGFNDEHNALREEIVWEDGSPIPEINPKDVSAYRNYLMVKTSLIAGEAHEAEEEIRAGHAPTEIYYPGYTNPMDVLTATEPVKPEGFPIELADVMIRTMALAKREEIDLVAAIHEKMNYNATRPYMHGKVI